MNPKSLAEIVRNIQTLANATTEEAVEEFDFYNGLFNLSTDCFVPGVIGSIIPINLGSCSVEKAKELAKSLDMSIVEGKSGTVYISWSKGLDID